MLFPGFYMKTIDSILENRANALANEPYPAIIKSPFAPITKTNPEEDIGFGGNLDKRVANKIQLMELKDKGNIARNRKKILVNINAFLHLAHYKKIEYNNVVHLLLGLSLHHIYCRNSFIVCRIKKSLSIF